MRKKLTLIENWLESVRVYEIPSPFTHVEIPKRSLNIPEPENV